VSEYWYTDEPLEWPGVLGAPMPRTPRHLPPVEVPLLVVEDPAGRVRAMFEGVSHGAFLTEDQVLAALCGPPRGPRGPTEAEQLLGSVVDAQRHDGYVDEPLLEEIEAWLAANRPRPTCDVHANDLWWVGDAWVCADCGGRRCPTCQRWRVVASSPAPAWVAWLPRCRCTP